MNGNSMKTMFSSASDDWATPQDFFDELDQEFDFTLDPCASEINNKSAKFYTKEQDGLLQNWGGERVFCNPPYGRGIEKWVEKCSKCELAVMLIPARTDTKWFHEYIYGKAEVRFIKGRLKFGDQKNSAPFPSMVVVFRSKSC